MMTHYSNSEVVRQIDASSRASFLIAGFALENALKGLLVYDNPDWIKNGRLNKNLESHSLSELSGKICKSGLVDLSGFVETFKNLEDGLMSWARYPCGLNKSDTTPEKPMTESLWNEYCDVMSALGATYKALLADYWKGIHVFHGKYKIKGSWLGHTD